MKNKLFSALLCILCLGNFQLQAQVPWLLGGNNLGANASLGSNTNFSVIFESFGAERGRLTNTGLWGFGTPLPISKVHVNSVAGQDPFRVQVNGASKLYVHNAGGVSIGSAAIPPANGLFVSGNAGIGTSTPSVKLHVVGGADASPSGGGYIVTGSTAGDNVAIDENEIMARNNGAVSTLFLNHNGGNVIIDGTNAGTNVGIGTTAPVSDLHIVHENGFISNGLTLTNNFAANLDWNIYSAISGGDLWLSHNGVFRGSFDGTNGFYTASDRKLKKDISGMENILERVLQLKPSIYRFNSQAASDNRKFIGMIAQDVLPLFPEAVHQHSGKDDGGDDFLTLDYSSFGVIAVKAIQEQQQTITNLENRINKLEAVINALTEKNQMTGQFISGASLEQNQPNPFNQATIIRYRIPTASKAQISIFDAKGMLVKTLNAPESGQVTINANDLKAGTYTYRLTVNGNTAVSKKMVILR